MSTTPHTWLPLVRLIAGTALLGAASLAAAADFTGRGNFAFASGVGCPALRASAAPGSASAASAPAAAAPAAPVDACNRIALDDAHGRASLDATARTIRITNDHAYERKTIVGDVLLQATGRAADGQRVPLNYHLVLSKSGNEWSLNSHAHAPVRGRFSDVRIDPLEIAYGDGRGTPRIVTRDRIAQALAQPALAARLANQLVQIGDNRSAKERAPDISVSLGVGRAALPVMRASLHGDTPLDAGTWELRLQALTGKIPDGVAQRELFLFGMAGEPVAASIASRGLAKGETLAVGVDAGQGYLRVGDRRQPFPAAADSARRFLQQSFTGLVLGWQQGGGDRDGR